MCTSTEVYTGWKVSVFRVFLVIKIRTRKTPHTGTFHAVTSSDYNMSLKCSLDGLLKTNSRFTLVFLFLVLRIWLFWPENLPWKKHVSTYLKKEYQQKYFLQLYHQQPGQVRKYTHTYGYPKCSKRMIVVVCFFLFLDHSLIKRR